MADLTVSANVDTLMQAANFAAFRTSLGLTALSTTTPGTGVATALAVNVGTVGAIVVLNGALGTPSSGTLTSCTGLPIAGITGLGTGIGTWLGTPTSANLLAAVTDETGSGPLVFATGPTLTTPNIGTPSAGTLSNCTAFPLAQLTGAGANVLAALASFSSANIATACTDETGTGSLVFSTSPALVTPALGTPASGNASNMTVDGTNLIGFRGIPQNSQSAAYTTVLADAGKEIFHPVGDNNARTFTIDSNANVAYVIGTVIKFKNMAATAATIAITTDTMTFLPGGTTGSRTLAQYGEAYAEKITSTSWTISGNSALT